MINVLVWGTGKIFYENLNLLKYHSNNKNIKVVAVTSKMKSLKTIYGYPYILKEDICKMDDAFDCVLVMAEGNGFIQCQKEAMEIGIEESKILLYKCLGIPGIDFKAYLELLKNKPTIFANNCWGGVTYHSLALPFTSPLVNMFILEDEYIKFLKKPKYYIEECEVEFLEMFEDLEKSIYYPIGVLGDIQLHFNHHKSFEEAKNDWDRRKRRINWEHLFVMAYTKNRYIAEEFNKLSYNKKVCFTNFQHDGESIHHIRLCDDISMKDYAFWEIVNGIASGRFVYYDCLKLILEGQVELVV